VLVRGSNFDMLARAPSPRSAQVADALAAWQMLANATRLGALWLLYEADHYLKTLAQLTSSLTGGVESAPRRAPSCRLGGWCVVTAAIASTPHCPRGSCNPPCTTPISRSPDTSTTDELRRQSFPSIPSSCGRRGGRRDQRGTPIGQRGSPWKLGVSSGLEADFDPFRIQNENATLPR
jgi:hypothetical protein